jgi:hypothetical protein
MEDLYPGNTTGTGFKVKGFARIQRTTTPAPRPKHIGRVVAGWHSFGAKGFFVYQDDASPTPSFTLRPLTVSFLSNAIGYDATFKFSLVQRHLGDVIYVSDTAARDGAEICQQILSVEANGLDFRGIESTFPWQAA